MKRIVFAVLVALLCGETAYLVVQQASNGSWTQWQKLSAPPERAEHIAWFNGGRVVVETVSHAYYSCDLYNAPNCWQSTSREQFEPYDAGEPWQPTNELAPPSLPRAAEIKYAWEGLGEISVFAAVAIQDDGTVLAWQKGSGFIEGLVGFLLPFCVSAASLFVSLTVGLWPRKRRPPSSPPRSQPRPPAREGAGS